MVLNDKNKKIISIIFVVTLITLFGLGIYFDYIQDIKRSNNFHKNKIVGEISHIEAGKSNSIYFNLKNDHKDYKFYQTTSSYEKRDFYYNVNVGDSIFKRPFSDTVVIKSDTGIYKYITEPGTRSE